MTVDGAWDRRRLARVTAMILALQVGLVFLLGARRDDPPAPSPRRGGGPAWKLAPASSGVSGLGQPLVDGPWVFSSADSAGFSGLAWMRSVRPEHQWARWEVAADLIDFSERPPVDPLAEFSGSPPLSPTVATPWPAPQTDSVRLGSPRQGRTEWHLEGEVVSRAGTNTLAFPNAVGTDVLAGTRVQIGVAADGQAVVARVIGTSGSRPADLQALQAAFGLRFSALSEAADPGGLVWGVLVVEWFTEAVAGGKQ